MLYSIAKKYINFKIGKINLPISWPFKQIFLLNLFDKYSRRITLLNRRLLTLLFIVPREKLWKKHFVFSSSRLGRCWKVHSNELRFFLMSSINNKIISIILELFSCLLSMLKLSNRINLIKKPLNIAQSSPKFHFNRFHKLPKMIHKNIEKYSFNFKVQPNLRCF